MGGRKRNECTLYAKHLARIKNANLYANDYLSTSITVQRGCFQNMILASFVRLWDALDHVRSRGENRGIGDGEGGVDVQIA